MDVNKFRNPNETEREWQMKKLFIEKYHDKYSEIRLLCLAQCYVNIETLGCRYSHTLTQELKMLTKDFAPILKERNETIENEMRLINKNNNPQPQVKQQKQQQKKSQNEPDKKKDSQEAPKKLQQKLISKTQIQEIDSSPVSPRTTPGQIKILPRQKPAESKNNQGAEAGAKSSTSAKPLNFAESVKQSNQNNSQSSPSKNQQQPSQPNMQTPSKNNSAAKPTPSLTPVNKNQTGPFLTPANKNQTGPSLASISQSQSIPKISSFSTANPSLTPSVPASTSEQAPAASLVPIPFGLTPSKSSSDKASKSRNALLNALTPDKPLLNAEGANAGRSILSSLMNLTPQNSLTLGGSDGFKDENLSRLNRINKLRELLKNNNSISNLSRADFNVVGFFEELCQANKLKLKYAQYVSNDDKSYYGETLLESFRLSSSESKQSGEEECKRDCYKRALDVLYSKSELAVKSVPTNKRPKSLALIANDAPYEYSFDLELYRLDGDESGQGPSSYAFRQANDATLSTTSIASVGTASSSSLPSFSASTTTATESTKSVGELNVLLKSMYLPHANKTLNGIHGSDLNDLARAQENSQDMLIDAEAEDDGDDERLTNEKKAKLKLSLPDFCLFLPSNFDYNEHSSESQLSELIHERNALQILNNSCVKSHYSLEFELKSKSASSNNSKSTKTRIVGINSDSDNDPNDVNLKHKCKCLINGVKIASAHSTQKQDAKRFAAQKAIRNLIKVFPIIKEMSYQNVNSNTLTNSVSLSNFSAKAETNPPATYFKISKEQLFGGSLPPTLFESTSLISSHQPNPSSQFGFRQLKKMGWKGEGYGLGKQEQGISKPVNVDVSHNRFGLGFTYRYDDGYGEELSRLDSIADLNLNEAQAVAATAAAVVPTEVVVRAPPALRVAVLKKQKGINVRELINNIHRMLVDFMGSQTENDLVFEKSLSTDERKFVHREAHKLGLKTRSEGKGENRFLVVSKKRSTNEILESTMQRGGQVSKYKLISTGHSL